MPDLPLHLVHPSEDLDREPDGVPHGVVGLVFVFSILLAVVVVAVFVAVSPLAAIVLAIIGIATMVLGLRQKAERERDHVHPSR